MNKLKLLPHYYKDYKNIIKEAIKSNNLAYNNWWYLHGKLENIQGYDKAEVINAKDCPDLIKMSPKVESFRYDGKMWIGIARNLSFEPHLYINDIIECEVLGIEDPCIGYFWTADESSLKVTSKSSIFNGIYWKQRGLVCLESDIEGREYAFKKYTEKSSKL